MAILGVSGFFGQDKKSQRQVTLLFQVRVAAEEAAADATGAATCGDQGWRPWSLEGPCAPVRCLGILYIRVLDTVFGTFRCADVSHWELSFSHFSLWNIRHQTSGWDVCHQTEGWVAFLALIALLHSQGWNAFSMCTSTRVFRLCIFEWDTRECHTADEALRCCKLMSRIRFLETCAVEAVLE